jgi:hypothetical protein
MQSYGIIVRYLNEVGLAAGRRFDCPIATSHGASSRSDFGVPQLSLGWIPDPGTGSPAPE